MRLRLTLIYLLMLLLTSCNAPKFVTNHEEYPKVNLDLGVDFVIIEDKRENVSISDDLKLPFISKAGQYDIVIPPLKSAHEDIIKQTISDNLNPDSKNKGSLTVQLINARKEYSATFWSERETAFIELIIIAKTRGKEFQATASREFMRKSVDATYKTTEKVFRSTLKEVTYDALKKLDSKISG